MVTDEQVRLLRKKMAKAETQTTAAAMAGMSERTARTWRSGPLPSQKKAPRSWRTRKDPFEEVWDERVVPLLEADEDGVLDATTILAELRRHHGEAYGPRHLRTLQRRLRDWRALHGPSREVMFEQVHEAGREGAFDFTDCGDLGVTIAGDKLEHLLFQLVLSFSKWRFVCLAFAETFEAMVHGLQSALWKLGGVPRILRSDNLSAATHQLPEGGRELTRRYKALLDHYGVSSTRIEPGESHQNGIVEKGHDVLKSALRQALLLRGSSDFATVTAYEQFVDGVVARLNGDKVAARLAEERAHLRPLPGSPVPEHTTYTATVRQWSTIHFGRRVYSVPSRLIGCEVEVRQHADVVEVWYAGKLTETMPRLQVLFGAGFKHCAPDMPCADDACLHADDVAGRTLDCLGATDEVTLIDPRCWDQDPCAEYLRVPGYCVVDSSPIVSDVCAVVQCSNDLATSLSGANGCCPLDATLAIPNACLLAPPRCESSCCWDCAACPANAYADADGSAISCLCSVE